jgi:high affinity sulfate transporter 1
MNVPGWAHWLPGLARLRSYQRADLPGDLAGGLALAAVTVPVAIAHAQLAGLGAAAGLYASIVPLLVYALVGSSPQLVLGTGAAAAAVIAAAVEPLTRGDPSQVQAVAATLTMVVGLLCLLGARLRLGALADFLSTPILVGFMNGVALSVVLGQLGNLFGFRIEAGGLLPRLFEFLRRLPETHWPTLALGAACLLLLTVLPRWLPRAPAALLVTALAAVVAWLLGPGHAGIAVLGEVAGGLPTPVLPRIAPEDWSLLLAEAAGIALLIFSNTMVAARSFADRGGYDIDADRELGALGMANLAAGAAQGFTVNGAGARTAVSAAAGARTQLAGIVAAGVLTALVLFATAPLAYLPRAAIAAVLIDAGLKLVNVDALRSIQRIDRTEFWLALLVMLGVVVLGAMQAILLAVALALALFVRASARPAVETLGTLAGEPGFVARERHPEASTPEGLLLFRFNGPIVFFSAGHFKRCALRAAQESGPSLRWFVLDMLPVTAVDATGVYALRDTFAKLRARGVEVCIAQRHTEWADWAAARGLQDALADLRLFATLRQAYLAYPGAATDDASLGAASAGADPSALPR